MQIAKPLIALFASATMAALPVIAQAQDRQPAPVEDSEAMGGENSVALYAIILLVIVGGILLAVREGNEDDVVNLPASP